MDKKTIYWTLGGIATALLGYYAYKKITAPTITFGEVDEPKETPTRPTVTSSDFPLKKGSTGENVKKLQRFLKAEGYNIGTFGANKDGVDGKFGAMTEKAVRENQQPFAVFKSMYPTAIEGQVSKEFFDFNIKSKY